MPQQITRTHLRDLTKPKLYLLIKKYLKPVCPHCGKVMGENMEDINLNYETNGYEYGYYNPYTNDLNNQDSNFEGDIHYTCPECEEEINRLPTAPTFAWGENLEMTERKRKQLIKTFEEYWLEWWTEHEENAIQTLLEIMNQGNITTTETGEQIIKEHEEEENNTQDLIANRNKTKPEKFFKCKCNHTTMLNDTKSPQNIKCKCGYKINETEFKPF